MASKTYLQLLGLAAKDINEADRKVPIFGADGLARNVEHDYIKGHHALVKDKESKEGLLNYIFD